MSSFAGVIDVESPPYAYMIWRERSLLFTLNKIAVLHIPLWRQYRFVACKTCVIPDCVKQNCADVCSLFFLKQILAGLVRKLVV